MVSFYDRLKVFLKIQNRTFIAHIRKYSIIFCQEHMSSLVLSVKFYADNPLVVYLLFLLFYIQKCGRTFFGLRRAAILFKCCLSSFLILGNLKESYQMILFLFFVIFGQYKTLT